MQAYSLSQTINLIKILPGVKDSVSSRAVEINCLSGSLASVARIAYKGGLRDISLYTNQGCIGRMLATLSGDLGVESVNGIYRKIEEVTRLRSLDPEIVSDMQIDSRFKQPEIFSNVFDGKISEEEIPVNARGLVEFFRSYSLPVILLMLDGDGNVTKISTPFSYQEVISEPHELESFARAELAVRDNIEREAGYRIREFYSKTANLGVPYPTANFVVDKIRK